MLESGTFEGIAGDNVDARFLAAVNTHASRKQENARVLLLAASSIQRLDTAVISLSPRSAISENFLSGNIISVCLANK